MTKEDLLRVAPDFKQEFLCDNAGIYRFTLPTDRWYMTPPVGLDAAKVLAAFGTTVRDETDLDGLTSAMLRVVDETVQPEFVGLWLREPESNLERTNAGTQLR